MDIIDSFDEQELLLRAQNATDILTICSIPDLLAVSEVDVYTLQYVFIRDQLDIKARQSIKSMMEANMKSYYLATWGWDSNMKTNEIFSSDSKFLIVRDSNLQIIAWSMFKFDWDDLDEPEHPVLFCYELQVAASHRRQKLGKTLMQALLKISSHFKMWKTMLTCFKLNTSALDFYKSIGFDIDANSPSVHGYDDECYEILSDKPKLK